jgi:hypothetical protein
MVAEGWKGEGSQRQQRAVGDNNGSRNAAGLKAVDQTSPKAGGGAWETVDEALA